MFRLTKSKPTEQELLEEIRWQKAQAKLSGDSDCLLDFYYEYQRHRLGYRDNVHEEHKPRRSGKTTTLIQIHQDPSISTWLVYPSLRMANIYWRRKDLDAENVGVISNPNLKYRIGSHRDLDVVLLDDIFVNAWAHQRDFMDHIRAAHGSRIFLYGMGTPPS